MTFVGHSQIPPHLEINNPAVEVTIYRAPGARAKTFFNDERLNAVLEEEYNWVILWLGSNDIKETSGVKNIVRDIQEIVETFDDRCKAEVVVSAIEPRRIIVEGGREPRVSQESYNNEVKGINRKIKTAIRGRRTLIWSARCYEACLAPDGVHFNQAGRDRIREKIIKCIENRIYEESLIQALGGRW